MKRHQPRWSRWLNVALRGVHQVTVVALGAAILGAPLPGGTAALAVLASGLPLFLLDLHATRDLLRERTGGAMLVKLLLVAWMAMDATARPWLFWLVVAWSTLFAHAPGAFRHARWRQARPDDAP